MDAGPLVAAMSVFVGTLALLVAVFTATGGRSKGVRRRLDVHVVRVSVDDSKRLERVDLLKVKGYSRIRWLNAVLTRLSLAETARVELLRADVRATTAQYLALRAVLAAILAAAAWLIAGPLFSPLGVVAGIVVPRLAVKLRASRRRKAFEGQLAEGIDLIVGALRAGYGFLQGIEAVTKEMDNPIASEFATLLDQVNVGANPVDVLMSMTERIDSYDLALFASAVSVNRTAGGNLAEVLENIAGTVRERRRIRAEVRALTTGPRVSGYVLLLIPILLLIAFCLMNPGNYRDVMLRSNTGYAMVVFAAIWSLMGLFLSQKVAKVEY